AALSSPAVAPPIQAPPPPVPVVAAPPVSVVTAPQVPFVVEPAAAAVTVPEPAAAPAQLAAVPTTQLAVLPPPAKPRLAPAREWSPETRRWVGFAAVAAVLIAAAAAGEPHVWRLMSSPMAEAR